MSLSAQRIGKMFGLTAQEMNMALKLLGYLDGEPGHYLPNLVREHRAAKNTEISENVTIIAETIHSAIGKAQENRGRQLSSKEIKTIGLVALIVIGTAATVTAVVLCVKNAKEKKSKKTLPAAKIVEMHQARTAVCRKNEA